MKKASSIFAFLFFCFAGNAQKIILYYKIDKIVPADKFARMDSLISKLKPGAYDVSIVGFADYLHNNKYNDALSLKRAEKAKEELLKSAEGFTFNVNLVKAEGENYSKESRGKKGESAQRKVEITFKSLRKLSTTKPGTTIP